MKEITNLGNWGDSGENGTMYDGLNLFDFYVSDEVTGQMESLIREEYEDITENGHFQEVYLGFYKYNNKIYFVSGWDILADYDISACLLHFEIEDSKMKKLEITEDSVDFFYDDIFNGINIKEFTHIRLD